MVRQTAISALSFSGDSKAVEPLLEVMRDDNDGQNTFVTEALGRLGKPAVSPLLLALSDEKKSVRERAIISLRYVNDPKVVEALITVANDESEDIELRDLAIYTLGYLGDRKAIEPLIKLLDNRHKEIHDKAALALSGLKAEQSLQPLFHMLKDANKRVRSDTITSLYRLGDRRAVAPIVQVLADMAEDEKVRADAAYALGQMGFVEAVEPLAIALEDSNWKVRSYAAHALGELKNKQAIAPLIKALKHADVQTRQAAIQALERFTDKQATAAVKKAKRDLLFNAANPDGKTTDSPALTHYSFNIYADYSQFYLGDEKTGLDTGYDTIWSWTTQALYDSLAVAPNFIAVSTARYNYVLVEVEVWTTAPDNNLDGWDQVAECSIEVPSGKLIIDGCLSFRVDGSPYIKLEPGIYNARIYYGGLESAAWDNREGQDYYKIALWPGEAREAKVIKRYWHPKADEYKHIKGKDRGW